VSMGLAMGRWRGWRVVHWWLGGGGGRGSRGTEGGEVGATEGYSFNQLLCSFVFLAELSKSLGPSKTKTRSDKKKKGHLNAKKASIISLNKLISL